MTSGLRVSVSSASHVGPMSRASLYVGMMMLKVGGFAKLQREPRCFRIVVKHHDGLAREFIERLADRVELSQDVWRDGDDVAPDAVCLHDVQELAGAGPD